jgi:hypothetical protein
LQRFVVLFFIDLATRKVEVAGIAQSANRLWMSQIARNLTDSEDGILIGKRYLIHDRDPLFTAEFLSVITETGLESVKLPPRSVALGSLQSGRSFRIVPGSIRRGGAAGTRDARETAGQHKRLSLEQASDLES